MKQKSRRFLVTDILLLAGIFLPILSGIVLKVLFKPASEGIEITGAYIFFTIPLPFGGLPVTESQVNSLIVLISLFFLCLFLTHGISEKNVSVRQHVAEWIVESTQNLVNSNMDKYFANFAPLICAILGLSAFSSLLSLCGLFAPTSDMNIVGGWAVLVFILITYYKMKCGPLHYMKSFADPVLLTPLNVISEVATPVSMAFRHYGNVMSGAVISVLVGTALQGLSKLLLGWLPGILGTIPFLQVGLPAILSVYFDLFSGCLQAFIFAMLTMMYVSGAFPADDYAAKKERRKQKNLEKMKV